MTAQNILSTRTACLKEGESKINYLRTLKGKILRQLLKTMKLCRKLTKVQTNKLLDKHLRSSAYGEEQLYRFSIELSWH